MPTQAPRVGGRECPLATCDRYVRPGQFMCGAHWRRVPKPLQTDVWSTWRKWQRTMDDTDWDTYLAARQAALDSLKP
jgi:hypothetical protein